MKIYSIALFLLINLLILPSAKATTVAHINLQQLSAHASLIFYAEVISNDIRNDEQSSQLVTFTKFKIIDLIKGNASSTHTIKQIGGRLANTGKTLHIHGVPKFQPGNSYVIFLPEKSTRGFSSPLGLHQGSFTVSTVNNEQVVSNGRNLTGQLAVNPEKPTQARLDDFINIVRAYNTP